MSGRWTRVAAAVGLVGESLAFALGASSQVPSVPDPGFTQWVEALKVLTNPWFLLAALIVVSLLTAGGPVTSLVQRSRGKALGKRGALRGLLVVAILAFGGGLALYLLFGGSPPTAKILTPADGAVLDATTVVFRGTGDTRSRRSLTYEWDFGDGEKGMGESVVHSFAQAGAYTISLTVSDGRKRAIVQCSVRVGNRDIGVQVPPSRGDVTSAAVLLHGLSGLLASGWHPLELSELLGKENAVKVAWEGDTIRVSAPGSSLERWLQLKDSARENMPHRAREINTLWVWHTEHGGLRLDSGETGTEAWDVVERLIDAWSTLIHETRLMTEEMHELLKQPSSPDRLTEIVALKDEHRVRTAGMCGDILYLYRSVTTLADAALQRGYGG